MDGLPQLTRQLRSRHTSAHHSSLISVVSHGADSQWHFDTTTWVTAMCIGKSNRTNRFESNWNDLWRTECQNAIEAHIRCTPITYYVRSNTPKSHYFDTGFDSTRPALDPTRRQLLCVEPIVRFGLLYYTPDLRFGVFCRGGLSVYRKIYQVPPGLVCHAEKRFLGVENLK